MDDTWGWLLLEYKNHYSNEIKFVRTYYDDYRNTCYIRGQDTNCMGQWESQELAEEGWTFDEILLKYYAGELKRIRQRLGGERED